MKSRDLMTTEIVSCKPGASLNEVARLMWENDCGCVVVTDDQRKLLGVLTDRDACMAAYTKGVPLSGIRAEEVMNREVATCSPDDGLATLHETMRKHLVRRVPITEGGKAAGIVSLNDLALHAEGSKSRSKAMQDVAETLAVICRHRQPISTS